MMKVEGSTENSAKETRYLVAAGGSGAPAVGFLFLSLTAEAAPMQKGEAG